MERVFISYRRQDGSADFWLVRERLGALPNVEIVLPDTSPADGETVWPDRLREAMDEATLVLVLVGSRFAQEDDWARQEVEHALYTGKPLLPVLVGGASMPTSDALPRSLAPLAALTAVQLQRAADLKVIADRLAGPLRQQRPKPKGVYPKPARNLPEALDGSQLERARAGRLQHWQVSTRRFETVPADASVDAQEQVGLYREYRFRTFPDAIAFMRATATGCELANHHPDWGNIWRTVRIFLTTWDIGHRVSERDVQLAEYLERAYEAYSSQEPEIRA